jgi:uncharacterized protein
VDPATGILHETEDNFGFASGLYRYIAPQIRGRSADCATAAAWRCSRSKASGTAQFDRGQSPGVTYGVEWVTIDEPDTTLPPATTNDQAIVFVGDQGRAKGAAIFSRSGGHLLRLGQGLPRLDAGGRHAGG